MMETIEQVEMDRKFNSLYEEVIARSIPFSSHESDLYIPMNEVTKALIIKHGVHGVNSFKSNEDGKMWYDVAFQYLPVWETRLVGKEKSDAIQALRKAYPEKSFGGIKNAFEQHVVAFEHNGMDIYDPYLTDNGFDTVDPLPTYGIKPEHAELMDKVNSLGHIIDAKKRPSM